MSMSTAHSVARSAALVALGALLSTVARPAIAHSDGARPSKCVVEKKWATQAGADRVGFWMDQMQSSDQENVAIVVHHDPAPRRRHERACGLR